MTELDELLAQVPDEGVRSQLKASIDTLTRQLRFGLVSERHLPESIRAYNAVDGFVEQHDGRVAEKDGGDAEASAHAEGELPARRWATSCSPTTSRTSLTRLRGMSFVWASIHRSFNALRLGWIALASSNAPISRSGQRSWA